MEAKRHHWSDYLKGVTGDDIWTINWYIREPAGDGGNPQILTLWVLGPDGFTTEVNTNDGKARALSDTFFLKPPWHSSVPTNFQYPDPLPNPAPITREQLEVQICCLSPYKASRPDEIPNLVLQKSFDLIADYLLYLFQAVFTL